jgi:hypothetical protein
LSIDLDTLLRRCKLEKWRGQLAPRPIGQLVAAASLAGTARLALVPDTNAYIQNMGGTLPTGVEVLLDNALQWHCSVRIAEIAAGIAHYDPAADSWRRVRQQYGILLRSIPDTRLLVPDAETWHFAGMIFGILARTQGFQPDHAR